jgi:hypothetical protein
VVESSSIDIEVGWLPKGAVPAGADPLAIAEGSVVGSRENFKRNNSYGMTQDFCTQAVNWR